MERYVEAVTAGGKGAICKAAAPETQFCFVFEFHIGLCSILGIRCYVKRNDVIICDICGYNHVLRSSQQIYKLSNVFNKLIARYSYRLHVGRSQTL